MNNTKNEIDISGIAQLIFTGFKWLSVFGFIVSVGGLGLSVLGNYSLWLNSTNSTGVIVEYNTVHISERSMRNSSSSSFETRLPMVKFTDHNGNSVNFEGKYGHSSDQKGKIVPIIFSNTNPKNAIIDLGRFHNWLSTYIWLFIMLFSLLGIMRFSKKTNLHVK